MKKPYIIVLGNEKGGTGKSTITMHLAIHFLYENLNVATIDVDARQGTLSRYIENRKQSLALNRKNLPMPYCQALYQSELNNKIEANEEEKNSFERLLGDLKNYDIVLVDTPGNKTNLSCLAHASADTIITPLNDSFIDLDMLIRVIKKENKNEIRPSHYSEMIWEQKKEKARKTKGSIDWIVLRNRLSSIYSKNKEEIEKILELLSKRLGCRLVGGFCERVIFRELFLEGLTLLDLRKAEKKINLSHLAAKQELISLIKSIRIPFF